MSREDFEVLDMNYEYDLDDDTLFIYGVDESEYKESLTVDESFVLDINDFNEPESFEILNISDLLEVDSELLLNPLSVNGFIEVDSDLISVNLNFVLGNKSYEIEKSQLLQMPNYFKLEGFYANININII